jgi:hypothetical protein
MNHWAAICRGAIFKKICGSPQIERMNREIAKRLPAAFWKLRDLPSTLSVAWRFRDSSAHAQIAADC